MTDIDFLNTVDFTALTNPTAADHNNLVDLAQPYTDKGILLVTTDTALDTPDVPNAIVTARWVRYLWLRKPHSTATITTPILYAWNANATSNPTYLKWEKVADVATAAADLQAQITALDGRVDVVEVSAANAVTQSGTAATQAAAAVLTANSANGTALAASANATTALANANTAQTTANNALALATANSAAVTAAAAAQSTANQALAAYNAQLVTASFPLTAGVVGTITHTFLVPPRFVELVLVCQAPINGYVAGDEISVHDILDSGAGSYALTSKRNATTVVIYSGITDFYVRNATTGAAEDSNPGNWMVKAYIWK